MKIETKFHPGEKFYYFDALDRIVERWCLCIEIRKDSITYVGHCGVHHISDLEYDAKTGTYREVECGYFTKEEAIAEQKRLNEIKENK